jgi:hypothetical protein
MIPAKKSAYMKREDNDSCQKKLKQSIFRARCTIQFWSSGMQVSILESCIPVSYTE